MLAEIANHVPVPAVPIWDIEPAAKPATQHFEHNETLFMHGDPAEFVFEIVEGMIAGYNIHSDGSRQILGFFFPGDLVGLSPDKVYHANTCAIGATITRRIPRTRLMQTAKERPEVAAKLFEHAAGQLVGMQNHFILLCSRNAREKVASFLYALALRNVTADEQRAVSFQLPMTRTEIADYLGLTIETVSRCITRLRIAGVIDLPKSSLIVVPDLVRLSRVTGEDVGGV